MRLARRHRRECRCPPPLNRDELRLAEHLPPNLLLGKYINGRDAIELRTEPIVYMREFMKGRVLSEELVEKVERAGGTSSR